MNWPGGDFWTPYRKGAVVALLWIGAALYLVFGLIAVLRLAMPLWTLAVAVLVATLSSEWMGSFRSSPLAAARCPECGKSAFLLKGGRSLRGRVGLLWPEKQCSECGADLTGGRNP